MNEMTARLIVVEGEESVLFFVGPVMTKEGWKELFIDSNGNKVVK